MPTRESRRTSRATIDELLESAMEAIRSRPRDSFDLFGRAAEMAARIVDPFREARARLGLAQCLDQFVELERAAAECDEAIRLSREVGRPGLLGATLRTRAVIHVHAGQGERAMELGEEAHRVLLDAGDRFQLGMVLNMLGMFRDLRGDHVGAMDAFAEAIAIWEELGDRDNLAVTYNNTATLSIRIGDLDRSIRYFTAAAAIHRENGNRMGLGISLRNLSQVLSEAGRPEEALPHGIEAAEMLESVDARGRLAMALDSLGAIYEALGRDEEGESCYRRAIALADGAEAGPLAAVLTLRMVAMHERAGDLSRAIEICTAMLDGGGTGFDSHTRIELTLKAATLHEQAGSYREALEMFKTYHRLREEAVDVERQKVILEMQTRYEATVLERENEIQRLRIEQLRQEVQRRDKDLAVQAMQLVERNEYLTRIERRIAEIGTAAAPDAGMLIGTVRAELRPEGEWEAFMQRFRQVHPEFEARVAERFPTLTPAELRVCVLTRLGLATKEIASLLFTSVRTIENQRASLRRKVGIPAQTALATFIAGL